MLRCKKWRQRYCAEFLTSICFYGCGQPVFINFFILRPKTCEPRLLMSQRTPCPIGCLTRAGSGVPNVVSSISWHGILWACQKDTHFGLHCKAMVLKLVELEGFENFASERLKFPLKSMKFASCHQHATI